MDSNNRGEERRDQREKWREEKRSFKEEARKQHRQFIGVYASGRGNVWIGVLLLIIGVAALLKVMLFPIPDWVFTWQMLLIIMGFFMGIRHNFRGVAWFILMLVGGVFLLEEFFPHFMLRQYLWPLGIILAGLFFIFRPRRRNWHWRELSDEKKTEATGLAGDDISSPEDELDSTSIFGGIKKTIVSKNFKGGEIVNIFGGSEIDLSQADINGTARLELTQIFGGTKLIVPSNWQVKIEMAAIFGGVEDKRSLQKADLDPNKTLSLSGTSMFGGIEIRSY
jgi:predicted membrane protein